MLLIISNIQPVLIIAENSASETIISDLKLQYKFSSQNEGSNYSVIMGPLDNLQANNLVLSFISKGYKKTEFILK